MRKTIFIIIGAILVISGLSISLLSAGGTEVTANNKHPDMKNIDRLSFDDSPTIKVLIPYVDEKGNEKILITDNKELYYDRVKLAEQNNLDFLNDSRR